MVSNRNAGNPQLFRLDPGCDAQGLHMVQPSDLSTTPQVDRCRVFIRSNERKEAACKSGLMAPDGEDATSMPPEQRKWLLIESPLSHSQLNSNAVDLASQTPSRTVSCHSFCVGCLRRRRKTWFSSHFWVSISSSFRKLTILNFNLAD